MNIDHLVGGAVYGVTFVLLAIAIPRFTRQILGAALVVAALCYAAFAIDARANAAWLAAELAGAGLYAYLGYRGVRGSAWWLVAGWALHPVWDVALHWAGPGRQFAPEWYTTSCLTYDLAVAGIAAIAILIGTHLTEAAGTAGEASRVATFPAASRCTCVVCTCGGCTCVATGARAA